MNDDEICFYTVKSFSKMINVSEQVLRKMIREGQIKSVRFNTSKHAKHRIPKSELMRLQAMAYETKDECQ